mmetsp:Transcript_28381/g.81686  ORF Transcript_28381/g.81686 Transcript_28381/m.81686 type:complete len:208 (+) Transcript_28381:2380-3003(+)
MVSSAYCGGTGRKVKRRSISALESQGSRPLTSRKITTTTSNAIGMEARRRFLRRLPTPRSSQARCSSRTSCPRSTAVRIAAGTRPRNLTGPSEARNTTVASPSRRLPMPSCSRRSTAQARQRESRSFTPSMWPRGSMNSARCCIPHRAVLLRRSMLAFHARPGMGLLGNSGTALKRAGARQPQPVEPSRAVSTAVDGSQAASCAWTA